MIDYSAMTEEQLDHEIAERKGANFELTAAGRYYGPSYVGDEAATFRALVEMPDVSLEAQRGTADEIYWVAAADRWSINGYRDVIAPNPPRAIWIAWLGWQDSKRVAGDVHVMVRSLHDEPGVAPIDMLRKCLDE